MTLGRFAAALGVVVGVATSACSIVFPAPAPMRTVAIGTGGHQTTRCLVVFLPGFGDSAESYDEHGFIDALSARSLPVDTVSTDASFGYYANRTILTRLQQDVILPARAKGYEQIWLVGTSMGGMGALLLANAEPSTFAGIYLVAPYLGSGEVLREIDRAGGVARWHPNGIEPGDDDRPVWRFLQHLTGDSGARPALYLGAGDTDKLHYGHALLAAALPPERVFRTSGGHDWQPWSILWAHFLDESDFRERCARPER
ncbi:MAG: alpha/beta hydrolase [Polyangiaceae bacterium]|nr:alpha/beta hydrolase [Polyangiaceae bacterium]